MSGVVCVGVKGGVGTSSAAALVAVCASDLPKGAVLVDLTGDASAMLGVEDGPGGVVDVVRGDADPVGLLVDAAPSLRLLRRGGERLEASRDGERLGWLWPRLAEVCSAVVVDGGSGADSARLLADAPLRRVLVSDAGFASLRRCGEMAADADAVVVRCGDRFVATAADAARVWGRDDVVMIDHDPMLAMLSESGRAQKWAVSHLAELAPLRGLGSVRESAQRSL